MTGRRRDPSWSSAAARCASLCRSGVFSTAFRYALISLVAMADQDQTLQTRQIASRFQLSAHYLAVVLRDLRRLGLVESIQGNRGGYRLLRAPEQINLLMLHTSLAGGDARESAGLPESEASPADRWLRRMAERWSQDLADLSLLDLTRDAP